MKTGTRVHSPPASLRSGPAAASQQRRQEPEAPAARPAPSRPFFTDGFDAPGVDSGRGVRLKSLDSVGGVTSSRSRMEGPDLTSEFLANPLQFTGEHVLNAQHIAPSPFGPPAGVTLPTAEQPLVDASASVVSLTVTENQGNAHLQVDAPGGPGEPAYYLQYANSNTGHLAGIQGIPLHPEDGTPTTIVTGALNGCAVWALHDANTNTLTFIHDHSYSSTGTAVMEDYLAAHPELSLIGSFTPANYQHPLGDGTSSGASLFIQYDPDAGEWMMVGQLNAPTVTSDGSSLALVHQPTGLPQQSGADVVHLNPDEPLDIGQLPAPPAPPAPPATGGSCATPDVSDPFPPGQLHPPEPGPGLAWVFPLGTAAALWMYLFGHRGGGSGRPEL